MKKSLLIGFIIIAFVSCKKDTIDIETPTNIETPTTVYDTVKPLDYFPVYPGSYWKYRVINYNYEDSIINGTDTIYYLESQDTSYVEYNVDSEYRLHSYMINKELNSGDTASEPKYVPFLNGKPIYGYNKIDRKGPITYLGYGQWPFMSETVGFTFIDRWYDQRWPYFGAYNEIYDKTVDENNDSMIIVYGKYVNSYYYGDNQRQEWKYYYKNIGLKIHYTYDKRLSDTTYLKELIDYQINK